MTTTTDIRDLRPVRDARPFDVADVVDWERWLDAVNHRNALELPVGNTAADVAAECERRGCEDPFV